MALKKENTKYLLSSIEGTHQALKMLHWSTKCKAEHLLTDEIDGDILSYEDRIAEYVMGKLNIRFGFGDLKSLLPESHDLMHILLDLENDVLSFKKDNEEDGGLMNIIDDMLDSINKWKYLSTFN